MKKNSIQKIIAGGILGIMAGVIFLWPHQTEATWFDDSYGYRQKITTGNTGSADTDKKIKFDVDTATLIGAGKMKSDCSDTRFTDVNGKLLQYYLDASGGACNTNSTDYYVLVPTINGSSNNTSIYMYYGNPAANIGTQLSQFTQSTFSPTSGPTFSGEEKGNGPILYWNFDSINGTTVNDGSSYSNNGTLGASTATPTIRNQELCYSGSCLQFDGSNDYVKKTNTATSGTAFVQECGGSSSGANLGITCNTTAGNLVVVMIQGHAGPTTDFSVSDTGGNTWTECAGCRQESSGIQNAGWMFYSLTTSSNTTITVTRIGTSQTFSASIEEFSGVQASPFDQFTSNADFTGSTSISSGTTGTTSQAYEVAVGYLGYDLTSSITNTSSGWTFNSQRVGTNESIMSGYKVLNSIGTESISGTVASDRWTSGIITFKTNSPSGGDVELNPDTGSFSVSAWFRHGSTISGTDTLISRADGVNGVGYKIYMNSSGYLCFGIDAVAGSFPNNSACGTTSLADSNWHHVVAVKSGTTTITLYIDGVQIAQTSSITSSSLTGFNASFYVGIDADGSSNAWSGSVDQVKVYNFEKTANQIKADFVSSASSDQVSAIVGSNTTQTAQSGGLLGYWKMDESSGNATDSSGNAFTLTNNNTITYSAGKYANGSAFNGTTQYFSTATAVSGIKSISFWTKPASNTNNYMNIDGSTYIKSTSGTVNATGFTSPTIYVNGVLNGTITANVWNYIVITTVTGVNATSFELGRANSSYLTNTSMLDDIRVYNRVLSATEISNLNEWSPGALAWWRLDERSGLTAYDSSGNGYTGSFTGLPMWSTGKYGGAVTFDGSSQAITATIADPGYSNTVEVWIYPTTSIASKTILTGSKLVTNSSSQPTYGTCTGNTIALNTWTHIAVVSDGASVCKIYQNGILTTSNTTGVSFGTTVSIAASSFSGTIDDVRIYNYPLTGKQIISDMNAGHPPIGSPIASAVGHWKFNEGYGIVANNTGNAGAVINGTLTNISSPATSTSGWTNTGKFDKALSLDSSGGAGIDYVSMGTSSTLSVNGPFTISAWIKPTSFSATSVGNVIMGRYDDASSKRNYILHADSAGQLLFQTSTNASCASGGSITLSSGKNLATGTWSYVSGTYDGAFMHTYINGIEVGTPVAQSSICTASTPFVVGARYGGGSIDTSTGFNGVVDDVKFYNYSLTPDQVKLDYNQGKSQVMGALSTASNGTTTDTSSSREHCVPGDTNTCNPPVGEWKLDENTGTSAADSSTNDFTGTLAGGTSWTRGKIGSAVQFNNINQSKITAADNSALDFGATADFTLESWVYRTGTSDQDGIVMKKNAEDSCSSDPGYSLYLSTGGNVTMWGCDASNNSYKLQSSATVNINTWYHVVAVWDDDNSTNTGIYINGVKDNATTTGTQSLVGDLSNALVLGIGAESDGGHAMDGRVDNVLIYDYARTPSQIAWDYNKGAPVGWWKFDEGEGLTAYDASGNGINGTLTNGPVWTSGKYNGGLSFDNTDDFIGNLNDNHDMGTNDFSITAWINRTDLSSGNVVIAKKNGGIASQNGWGLYCTNGASCTFYLADGTNQFTISAITPVAGQWVHLAVVLNRASNSNSKFYVNGVDATSSRSGTISSVATVDNALNLRIGSYSNSSNVFNGIIDDVRIYKYTLTENQVKTVYGYGALYFGPATGSP